MPITFPDSSVPMYLDRSQRPALRLATACGMFRASAITKDIVSSAADVVLPPGVFMTRMPADVAAERSMLSTPTVAAPASSPVT